MATTSKIEGTFASSTSSLITEDGTLTITAGDGNEFTVDVKKGDTLGAIARRYRVTTAQIMRWNKLKSAHKLRIGQRLRIEGR